MGLSFSQQISKNITNGYMDAINQLTASVTTIATQGIGTVNSIHLSVCIQTPVACGTGPCTINGINFLQNNSVNSKLDVTTLQRVVDNVKSDLQNTTTQYIKSLNQQEQSWLSFAFNINSQSQESINNFSQKISNLIFNDVSTNCSTSIISSNDATIVLCGNITQPVNIAQNNTVLAAQSCISKQIINNIISNKELFDGMQYADQQNYGTSNGPFSFLYYIGLFVLFIIIVITIAGVIRYATRGPKPLVTPQPLVTPTVVTA